jgi:hypothetical protein
VRVESGVYSASRTIGGWGERAFFPSACKEIEDGDLEGGKEDREGWRCTVFCPMATLERGLVRETAMSTEELMTSMFAERAGARCTPN